MIDAKQITVLCHFTESVMSNFLQDMSFHLREKVALDSLLIFGTL